jgi:hypothetical protein
VPGCYDHHPAALDPTELLKGCEVRRGRASGPGGQHRNKVETAVYLTHRGTGVTGSARERRSQAQNLQVATQRLRVNLALEVRLDVGADYRPSELWRSRSVGGRLAINLRHRDYPAVLAEALDVVVGHAMDPAAAAGVMGCTASQLLKLLRGEPRALGWVNDRRREAGLHKLR